VDDITLTPTGSPFLSPSIARRRRADALANEASILAAATTLFAKDDIGDVTMSAIAREAGIGKGTLYRAFANKGELCLALMDEDLRRFQDRTLALLAKQSDAAPLALLAAFLDSLVRFLAGHAALMCEAEAHGALRNRPEINQTSLHEWFRTTVLLLLRKAQSVGEIGGGLVNDAADLDYLADAVLAPLNPRLIRHQLRERDLNVDIISSRLVRFVLGGVRGERVERLVV
jgi:AcrR family transcriptional regulator